MGVTKEDGDAFSGVGETLALVIAEVSGEAVMEEEVEGQGEGVDTSPEEVTLAYADMEGEDAAESDAM